MKTVPVGTKGKFEQLIEKEHLASELDTSLASVLSTPTMVAMMERAAMEAIKPFLDAGESSVGMSIEVSHTAATPPGHRARAEAEVTKVEGRRIEFKIEATDGVAPIGTGTHERMLIDMVRFVERLNQNRA